MDNSNLLLALANTKKNFVSSSSKKTTSVPTDVTKSYRSILQESISDILRPPVRNANNSSSTNSQVIRGDANDDGVIDEKDKKLFLDRMFDDMDGVKSSVKVNMKNIDFSGDGKITADDYVEFLKVYKEQQNKLPQVLKGDANGDGKVDIKDADLISLRMIGLGKESKFDMNAADMDGDGEITNTDLTKVNQLIKENESNVKTLQGDSNGDGVVDESDYKNIDDYLSGKDSAKNFIRKNSDVNGDHVIDEQDLKGLRNILNGRPADWDESKLGDANGDGKINAKDQEVLARYSVGLKTNSKIDMNYADFDNDGKITGVDILKLSQLVKKYEDSVKTIQGDSNGDGIVNESDYKNINNYLLGKESNEDFVLKNSDINGDGVVDKKDLQGVRNILDDRKIDWDESKRLLGDVNGDGKIDVMGDALTIQNYTKNKIQKKDFYWDNADVNHDGKIDLEDAKRIEKFYNGEISSLDQKITKIAPPFEKAVITADTAVYSDFFFMNKNNDQLLNGDIVRVIGKSSDGTAFEIAFPNTEGGELTGWVSVNNLKEYTPDIPPIIPDDIYVKPTKTSDKGIELIKSFEGFKEEAYLLSGEKYYTIGYGHTGKDVYNGMKISREQAEKFLREDLAKAEDAVNRYCSHLKLHQNQFDALVSFTFNCGEKNLNKLLHGESGNENRPLEELPEHMPYYRKGSGKILPGLVNRRNAEVDLFNTPV